MKWNNVNDRHPEKEGRYLGWLGKSDIYEYRNGQWYIEKVTTGHPSSVMYWMELPPAPITKK